MMREFLETLVTLLIIIITFCAFAWGLGLLAALIVSFGVSENIVFFIMGFAVGCLRKRVFKCILSYSDVVFSTVTQKVFRR
jgi:hypothetical protein